MPKKTIFQLISLLEQNPNKIDWDGLSVNPNAIPLLEQNQDKIVWNYFSHKDELKINWKSKHKLEKVETLKKTPGLITKFADDSSPTDNP